MVIAEEQSEVQKLVDELGREEAVKELLKRRYPRDEIDKIFQLTQELQNIGIENYQPLTEEAEDAIKRMPSRLEAVLGLRLMGYTEEQIGRIYGITRERVRQLEDPICVIQQQLRRITNTLANRGVQTRLLDHRFPDSRDYGYDEIAGFARRHRCAFHTITGYVKRRNELRRYGQP